MVKLQSTMIAMAAVILMIIINMGTANGEQCVTNCGNGYCCPASFPMCVQGLPKCCPRGTIFYYNGYCFIRLGKSGGEQTKSAAEDAAHTMI